MAASNRRRPPRHVPPWIYLLAVFGSLSLTVALLYSEDWLSAAACFLAALGCGWLLAKRYQFHVVGPLFLFELIRLARSGRTTFLRCLYALVLLFVLWMTWNQRSGWGHPHFGGPGHSLGMFPEQLAWLAEQFTFSILTVQNVAVIVLTPLYLAGAIIDDGRRGTLDLLLGSHLHDHEIVLGKLFARLIALGSVLLAGLPVLALIQLWGGVNLYLVVGGFIAAAFALLHVGAVSIFCSVGGKNLGEALLFSYALVFFTMGICGCPRYFLGFSSEEFSPASVFWLRFRYALLGLIVYCVAAYVLWWSARKKFCSDALLQC